MGKEKVSCPTGKKDCAMRWQIKKAGGQRRKPDKGAPDIPRQKDIVKKT